MANGFIKSVLARFRGHDNRLAYLERTVKALSKELEALPSATAFGDGVGAWHPLANNRDLIMVQVLGHNVSANRWFARKIVYQSGAGGSGVLVPDEDDQDQLWIFPAPGQQLFPGARGFAVHVCEIAGTVIHTMVAGEASGMMARITGTPLAASPDHYPWQEMTDGSYDALDHSTTIGTTTLGRARAADSLGYDTANVTERMEFAYGTPVRLYWDPFAGEAGEMFFCGGVDPQHGPCL